MIKMPGIVQISAELITDSLPRLIHAGLAFILKQWYTPFFAHLKCFFQFFFSIAVLAQAPRLMPSRARPMPRFISQLPA